MTSSTESRLDALAGLTSAKRVVRRIATGQTGVHAVLFYGAAGSGKGELARILAESWLCRNPNPEGADGTCQACASYARGSNPDLLRIDPTGPSSIIRVTAITRGKPTKPDDPEPPLNEFFRTPPLMSRNKVTIISDAHRMNDTASHSLLKTLEEPHPFAKLILLTPAIGGILPTILSRCLAIACELPTVQEVAALDPSIQPDEIRLGEGAPGRVLSMARHREVYSRIAAFAKGLPRRTRFEALKVSDEFRSIAEAISKATDSGARAANTDALALLAIFLSREPGVNPRWPQHVAEAHRRVQMNASPGYVFDALFTRMLRRN